MEKVRKRDGKGTGVSKLVSLSRKSNTVPYTSVGVNAVTLSANFTGVSKLVSLSRKISTEKGWKRYRRKQTS